MQTRSLRISSVSPVIHPTYSILGFSWNPSNILIPHNLWAINLLKTWQKFPSKINPLNSAWLYSISKKIDISTEWTLTKSQKKHLLFSYEFSLNPKWTILIRPIFFGLFSIFGRFWSLKPFFHISINSLLSLTIQLFICPFGSRSTKFSLSHASHFGSILWRLSCFQSFILDYREKWASGPNEITPHCTNRLVSHYGTLT